MPVLRDEKGYVIRNWDSLRGIRVLVGRRWQCARNCEPVCVKIYIQLRSYKRKPPRANMIIHFKDGWTASHEFDTVTECMETVRRWRNLHGVPCVVIKTTGERWSFTNSSDCVFKYFLQGV